MVRHDRTVIRPPSRLKLEECGLGGPRGCLEGRHSLNLIPSGYLTENSEKNQISKNNPKTVVSGKSANDSL